MSGYYEVLTDTQSERNQTVPVTEGHECSWCGEGNAAFYRADPVQEEIHDLIVMKYYHDDCYYESARDI